MDAEALTLGPFSANFTMMNVTPPAGFGGPIDVPEGCEIFPFSINNPWENPEDPITYDTFQLVAFMIYGRLTPSFFLLAVPLNIINIIVFYRQGIKERINLCLFVLALDDVIVIASIFEVKMDWFLALLVEDYPHSEWLALKFNFDYMIQSSFAFIHFSRFMPLVIAMERCMCVVSPLKARTMFNFKTSAIMIGAGHVILYGMYFPLILKYQVICVYDPFILEQRSELYFSNFYQENKRYIDNYENYLLGMVIVVGFDIGVVVFTVITLIKMSQMKEWRDKSLSSVSVEQTSNQSLNLTRMLVANNIFFVFCTIPFLIYHTLILVVPDLNAIDGRYINTQSLILCTTDIFAEINSTASFFFYFIFGTKFRKSVQRMFSRSRKRQRNISDVDAS